VTNHNDVVNISSLLDKRYIVQYVIFSMTDAIIILYNTVYKNEADTVLMLIDVKINADGRICVKIHRKYIWVD
jgi:hypothetical protein